MVMVATMTYAVPEGQSHLASLNFTITMYSAIVWMAPKAVEHISVMRGASASNVPVVERRQSELLAAPAHPITQAPARTLDGKAASVLTSAIRISQRRRQAAGPHTAHSGISIRLKSPVGGLRR